jgi:hypothetical protein
MRIHVLTGLLVLLSVSSIANAGLIEYPLMDLIGTYPFDGTECERRIDLNLSPPPFHVEGASLRITGFSLIGSVICSNVPLDWPVDFYAHMPVGDGSAWYTGEPSPSEIGYFTWTTPFYYFPEQDGNWSFMYDGQFSIMLCGSPRPLVGTCSIVSQPPQVELVEAVLILDADFPTPSHVSTWGNLKALYR